MSQHPQGAGHVVVDPTTSTQNELDPLNGEGCLTGGHRTIVCELGMNFDVTIPIVIVMTTITTTYYD